MTVLSSVVSFYPVQFAIVWLKIPSFWHNVDNVDNVEDDDNDDNVDNVDNIDDVSNI